jgi:hypothetical protein
MSGDIDVAVPQRGRWTIGYQVRLYLDARPSSSWKVNRGASRNPEVAQP